MKLIVETIDNPVQLIQEETSTGAKKLCIEGIFMQSDTKNRNGRVYPSYVMKEGVDEYNTNFVLKKRAMGELGHPETASINMERVSHLITELRIDGSNVIGKATILDTPYGNIARGLLTEGVQLGVSSRALGDVIKKKDYSEVQKGFRLATVDIVADPSAPEAFVNGIMEGVEWIYQESTHSFVEKAEKYKKKLDTGMISEKQFIENFSKILEQFSKL